MKSQEVKKIISKLPDAPGVYFFKKGKDILYIGKATSLHDRVRSYFSGNIGETRGPLISKMLSDFDDIIFQKTDSVLEALVLEADLIKKYQPVANIRDKDNRSFNYVVITDEDFPRVLIMRQREIEKFFLGTSLENHGNFLLKISSVRRRRSSRGFSQEDASTNFSKTDFQISNLFGPFPNGSQLKAAMKIVRRMFPYRDKCVPAAEQKPNPLAPFPKGRGDRKETKSFSAPSLGEGVGGGRPCFNYQIGLCPGVCIGVISKEDYQKQIKNLELFFEGNKKKLIKNLEKEMKTLAKERKFEKADKIKRQMFALYHIQDVSLIKDYREQSSGHFRIESYDIAHLSGTNVVGVMTVVEDGEVKKSDYRKFKIKYNAGLPAQAGVNDTKALSEILSRRLAHIEWPEAELIVVDGGLAQKRVMEKVLKENGVNIPVVSVVKDERHRPKEILGTTSLKLPARPSHSGRRGTSINYSELEPLILLANAEAHRFAIGFHKHLRGKLP